MNETDYSLSPGRLMDLVKQTLLVMHGRGPFRGIYAFDAVAVW